MHQWQAQRGSQSWSSGKVEVQQTQGKVGIWGLGGEVIVMLVRLVGLTWGCVLGV